MTRIPLKQLAEYNPFKNIIWEGLTSPITLDEVTEAIQAGRFLSTPSASTREEHIQRVAYLVLNVDQTPIDIDVGIPVLNYVPLWPILDGHHRLAAAFYSKDSHIEAAIQGDLTHAVEMFELYHSEEELLVTTRTSSQVRGFE
jgi:hypothetical protein